MEIEYDIINDILVVVVGVDRLDAKNAAEFKQNLLRLIDKIERYQVVFNLVKLNFIDSSGVGVFLSTLRLLNSLGGELKLANMTQPVRTILELISMHKIFEVFKTVDEAVSSFKSNPL